MVFRKNLVATLLSVFLWSLTLTACEPLLERISSAIGSKSPEEALVSIRGNMEAGKFKEAKAEAESFALKPGPRQAEFALATAQACGNLGDINLALEYLTIALKAGIVSSDALIVDRNFEAFRTDIRFVSLLTGQTNTTVIKNTEGTSVSASISQTPKGLANVDKAEPATSTRMDSQAIEVKAGSISIKLPN
jgi:hypothetical protein